MKRKVCVVVTARPSYARVKTALRAIAEHPDLELQLVVAASALLERYGNAARVIEDDGFRIAARVSMVLEGEDLTAMAKTTGIGLLELPTVFGNLRPDVVVSIADRFETMATAVAAAYMNLPLCHLQGGEITGSIDEKVRHAITKLADLHLVCTDKAAANVERMGEDPGRIFVTGCPSIDIAREVLEGGPELDFDPFEKYGGVGAPVDLNEHGYLVVLQHPVTTEYEQARTHVTETLHAVHALGLPTLWFWPNVDAGADGTSGAIRSFREIEKPKNIHFFKNMTPEDFLRLLYNSRGIVGNSSVGIRECSYLGVPAVNIGSRQFGRERGINVIDVDYDRKEITAAIRKHIDAGRPAADHTYGDGTAGAQVADHLATQPLHIEKHLRY